MGNLLNNVFFVLIMLMCQLVMEFCCMPVVLIKTSISSGLQLCRSLYSVSTVGVYYTGIQDCYHCKNYKHAHLLLCVCVCVCVYNNF